MSYISVNLKQVINNMHLLINRFHNFAFLIILLSFIYLLTATNKTKIEGLRVNMHVPADYLQQFANLLLPFKTYYRSNAIVRVFLPDIPVGEYPYYWVATNKTHIQQIQELQWPSLPLFFVLHPFAMLDTITDTYHLISI